MLQCDQMATLFCLIFAYLLTTMRMCPKYIKSKVCSKFCQIQNKPFHQNGQSCLNIMPKWRNFAKSGHTVGVRKYTRSDWHRRCIRKLLDLLFFGLFVCSAFDANLSGVDNSRNGALVRSICPTKMMSTILFCKFYLQ